MEKRKYRDSNEQVSLLGFGSMRLPIIDGQPQNIDKEKAQEMVDYAIAHGVNYFDTAYLYHSGMSESFLGEALAKYPRDSYLLATKMPPFALKSTEDVERIFEEQLKKCKVDYFDYYLLHFINERIVPIMEKFNVYEFLKEKQRQGKIRHLGFSFHDHPELLDSYTNKYDFDFAQIQLNYLDWQLQDSKRQYEILTEKGLPVIVMEPVRGGALVSLCEESLRIYKAADENASIASWAIRYVATLPNVLTVLSGMSNMEQIKDNIHTMTDFKPLSEKEYEVVSDAVAAYRASAPIPCTACGYCMDCPAGVDIPKVFGIYNQSKTSGNATTYLMMNLPQLGSAKQSHNCINCGQCMEHCPQKIKIPEQMELITAFTNETKEKMQR